MLPEKLPHVIFWVDTHGSGAGDPDREGLARPGAGARGEQDSGDRGGDARVAAVGE